MRTSPAALLRPARPLLLLLLLVPQLVLVPASGTQQDAESSSTTAAASGASSDNPPVTDPKKQDTESMYREWASMEAALRTTAEKVVQTVFPALVRVSSEAELSGDCQAALLKVILGVRRLRDWAIRLADASGKMPMGVMTGSLATLGSFDQCLSVRHEEEDGDIIVGRYCTLNIQFPGLPRPYKNSSELIKDPDSFMHWVYNYGKWIKYFPIRIGVCLPSHCEKEDLEKLGRLVVKRARMKSWVGTCEVEGPKETNTIQLVVMSILGVLAICVLVGTLVDRIWGPRDDSKKPRGDETPLEFARDLALSFSFLANTRKLLQPARRSSSLGVLHGIRVVSCLWIILGHTYFLGDITTFVRFKRLKTLEELNTDVPFTAIENFLPVDTFFFISGLLIVYSNWPRMEKKKGKLNIISSLIQRFWRMTPSYLLVMAVFSLLPLFGSGPLWHEIMNPLMRNCAKSWWTNLLYVSNYLPYDRMCLLHTWFQAVNMQFFVLALPLILFVYKCSTLGLALLVTLCLSSCVAVGLITYFFDLPPALLLMTSEWSKAVQQLNLLYFQPFTHFGPFCVGLLCGYYLVKNKTITMSKVTLWLGWLCALLCGLVSLWGVYPFRAGFDVHPALVACYAALHRTIWCTAIAWLTVACHVGHGGLLNTTLAWGGLVPLSTLSYLIYLIHPLVIYMHVATAREIVNLDQFSMCYSFLGHTTVSVLLAYVAHVTVELPFANLKALLMQRRRASLALAAKGHQAPLQAVVCGSANGHRAAAAPQPGLGHVNCIT
ncbi:O-acyltransferase like protein-like [Dermacentor variabilis]|uniref:O-acyltransferase like protein-like n=1 Tax=Dermacentor variabilis TaxID=34621 RepID=UPI003F5B3541